MSGFSEFNVGSLNNILKINNLPQAKDGFQYTTMASVSFPISGMLWDLTGGISHGKADSDAYDLKQRMAFLEYCFQLYAYQKNAHHLFFNAAFGVASYQVNIHENGNSNSFSNALDDFGGSLNID